MKKILIKIVVDTNQVQRKHIGDNLLEWENYFQQGKMREDLVKHLKGISKQLKKILKIIASANPLNP